MTANVFGKRITTYEKPAWHRLTEPEKDPIMALAAFEKRGAYEVEMEELTTASGIVIPYKAIVRGAVPDDPERRFFGVAGPDYNLFSPRDICTLADEHIAKPIETEGALGKGERFFISYRLPDVGVKGEEVNNYFIIFSPMTGGDAAQLLIAPVAPVCENTLIAAQREATEYYRIVHDSTARARMAEWMTGIYERALAKGEALREAFTILAEHKMHGKEVDKVLAATYPLPTRMPGHDAPEDVVERRMRDWEAYRENMLVYRVSAKELYEGKGKGADAEPRKGTAWGLYNAVTEQENYRRWHSTKGAVTDILIGGRARTMERAFTATMEVSKN